jgi:Zn-dependent peptidase ImmA (M78 family)
LKFPVVNIPNIRASTVSEIESAADQCRTYWDIGLDAPLVHVARAMEHAGIIIVPHVANSKVDAFSRFGRNSVIFLNQTIQSTSRWNFDIAHECGHLVLHVGIPTGSIETEAAADRFAGAFLMPRKGFERDFATLSNSFWTKVFELKRRWRASAAAIVRRAYDLGLIGAVQYRQAFKYMSYQGWRTQGEPFEPQFQEPELLLSALNALGEKVDITTEQLCKELNFKPEMFCQIVGLGAKADCRAPG